MQHRPLPRIWLDWSCRSALIHDVLMKPLTRGSDQGLGADESREDLQIPSATDRLPRSEHRGTSERSAQSVEVAEPRRVATA